MIRITRSSHAGRALLVTGLLSAATLVYAASPALASSADTSADTSAGPSAPLLLSNDGVTWGAQLAHPLFDAAHRYVPGDRMTGGYWLQNNSGHDAYYTVQVTRVNLAPSLAGHLSVSVGGDASETPVATDACTTVVSNVSVSNGERVYLPSTVSVSPDATLDARNSSASLSIGTTLHDGPLSISDGTCLSSEGQVPGDDPDDVATPTPPTSDGAAGTSTDSLALTGIYLGGWGVLAAVLSGLGIVIAARRRRESHE